MSIARLLSRTSELPYNFDPGWASFDMVDFERGCNPFLLRPIRMKTIVGF